MDGGFRKAPPANGSLGAWFSKLGEGRENPKQMWLSWDSLCLSFIKVPEGGPGLRWFLTEPGTQSRLLRSWLPVPRTLTAQNGCANSGPRVCILASKTRWQGAMGQSLSLRTLSRTVLSNGTL